MSQIHGQATIRINGQVHESEDDATLMPGGLRNNGNMIGQKFFHNQSTESSKVTAKFPVTKDVSLVDLQKLNGIEITFESDMGVTYIIRDACQTNTLELSGGESGGTVDVEFMGNPAQEMR